MQERHIILIKKLGTEEKMCSVNHTEFHLISFKL